MRAERGIAAITALLVVAIATILAVQLAWQASLDVRRTETMLLTDQARQYALGAESYAIVVFQTQLQNKQRITSDDLEGFSKSCTFDIEGGQLACRVEDMQGRFDLNNLVNSRGQKDPVVVEQFRRLVTPLAQGLKVPVDPNEVVDSVVDWIDPGTEPELAGAEDGYYTTQDPPYWAANFWFTTPSELRAVKGVTDELYQKLEGCVSALPAVGQFVKLNVNAMKVPVFLSLGPQVAQGFPDLEVTRDDAQNCEADFSPAHAKANTASFESTAEFQGRVEPAMMPYLGVDSAYFGLYITVSIGTVRLNMYSLIERSGQTATVRVRSFDVT